MSNWPEKLRKSNNIKCDLEIYKDDSLKRSHYRQVYTMSRFFFLYYSKVVDNQERLPVSRVKKTKQKQLYYARSHWRGAAAITDRSEE